MNSRGYVSRLLQCLASQRPCSLGPVWRYGLAVLIVLGVTVLRWALVPWLGTTAPYNLILVGITLATVTLGTGAGLVVAVLGCLGVELFVVGSLPVMFEGATLVRLGLSLAISSFIVGLFHALRAAHARSVESQTRLAALGAATFEGIVESEGGRIVQCNEAFARMMGRTVAELKGVAIAELIPPEDRERVLANIEAGRESAIEHAMLGPDGTRLIVEARGRPLLPERGRRQTVLRDITERQRARAALRDSEARFRTAFDNGGIAMSLTSIEGRIMSANGVFCQMLGYGEAELVGRSFVEITHPDDQAENLRGLERMQQGRASTFRMEKRYIRKDGGVVWGDMTTAVLRDAPGEPAYCVTHVQDITERKRAEGALRDSERKFRALFDNSRDAILIYDMAGHFADANREACERLGYSREELLRMGPQDIDSPEAAARVPARLQELSERGHALFETEHQRRDGIRVLVESNSTLVDLGGRKLVFSTFRDITARKQAEAALRESEEQFRATFNVSSVGKAQADPATGRFLRVNAAYCRITGYTEAELLRRTVADLSPPEDREKDWAGFSRMGSGQAAGYETEKRYVRKDGRVIWVRVYANLIRDEAGRPSRAAAVIEDITEHKAFRAELERLVGERTEKLQETVNELEHFSYSITHDLKAPLRAMKGFAEMAGAMCSDCSRPEAQDALAKISTSAERMEGLITDALNYSRSLRQDLPLTDVDTGALLQGMLDSYPELQPLNAQIQVEGKLPVVLGNEAGLTQVFSNLLGNAVKFVKPGENPQIRIWAEDRDGWDRIWVEDKGVGISQAMLPRVFDMFSRGSKSYTGTGIGLALVRKVMQRMGGRVGVESEEGKGTRFWIELELSEARPEPGRVEVASAEPTGGTVLYVEDEESDAMFMTIAFADKGQGLSLRVVGDGRAAVEYLSGEGKYADRTEYPLPSVVLLDLNLPQLPGFEVLKWMKNHPDFARTPVVVFSSSTREDDRVKALELGADEFVGKPSSGLKFGEVVEGLRERWMAAAVS